MLPTVIYWTLKTAGCYDFPFKSNKLFFHRSSLKIPILVFLGKRGNFVRWRWLNMVPLDRNFNSASNTSSFRFNTGPQSNPDRIFSNPKLTFSTWRCTQILGPMGYTVTEKREENFIFILKNWFREKCKTKSFVFFDVYVCFLTILSGNGLSFAAHQMHI